MYVPLSLTNAQSFKPSFKEFNLRTTGEPYSKMLKDLNGDILSMCIFNILARLLPVAGVLAAIISFLLGFRKWTWN